MPYDRNHGGGIVITAHRSVVSVTTERMIRSIDPVGRNPRERTQKDRGDASVPIE
jgi:hypothetical protein